jgi:hypothetical protein
MGPATRPGRFSLMLFSAVVWFFLFGGVGNEAGDFVFFCVGEVGVCVIGSMSLS